MNLRPLTAGCKLVMVASCRCQQTKILPLRKSVTVCKMATKNKSSRKMMKKRSSLTKMKRCMHLTLLITAMSKITTTMKGGQADLNISDLYQSSTYHKMTLAIGYLTGGLSMMKP